MVALTLEKVMRGTRGIKFKGAPRQALFDRPPSQFLWLVATALLRLYSLSRAEPWSETPFGMERTMSRCMGFGFLPDMKPCTLRFPLNMVTLARTQFFLMPISFCSYTLSILDAVGELVDASDQPSAGQLWSWRRVINNATSMKFNVGWLDVLWQEAEIKANSRRTQLPSIIASLKERIVAVRATIDELKVTWDRLIQESITVAGGLSQAKKTLETERQL
ncbi:uncharacterized protein LOC113277441 [Papaver somniferum]|nr:uncharacterized protein LOC113277441 [Papaver somniferum]